MRRVKIFGWSLVVLGFLTMLSPYISNSTGFFATLYAASSPIPTRFDFNVGMLIISPIIIAIGYVLVKKNEVENQATNS